MKKSIILSFSFVLLSIIYLTFPQEKVEIIFCDVGQGDAILISHNNNQLLIDTGRDEKVLKCLEDNLPFWDKTIEIILLTHMDSDHISGLPQVLAHFDAKYIFMNPSNKKTSDFEAIEEVVSRESGISTRVLHTFVGQHIILTKMVQFVVVSPQVDLPQVELKKGLKAETILSDEIVKKWLEKNIKNSENSLSIATFITIGDVRVFLSGDLEEKGELAIVSKGMTRDVSILKAGHHGSKMSSNQQFISVLIPEVSVVSSGENNPYNHPNTRVIETFNEFGVKIYQTSEFGEVKFITNGLEYWEAIRPKFWK